ncbi:MAG: hypothetical protein AAGM67_15330 [Bacteroidota bacterium]
MKNLLFAFCLFFSLSLYAQPPQGQTRGDFKVERMVLLALEEDFPGATDILWTKSGFNYEAAFQHDEFQMKARYTKDGMLLFKEFVVPKSRYRTQGLNIVWEKLAESYPGYRLEGIYLCQSQSKEYYRAEIWYRGQSIKLQYNTQGNLIGD